MGHRAHLWDTHRTQETDGRQDTHHFFGQVKKSMGVPDFRLSPTFALHPEEAQAGERRSAIRAR